MANPYVEEILSFVPAICILMVMLALIKGMSMFATKRRLSADYKRTLIPQFLVVITAFVGILIVILALPISGETRGQVLGLLGVVFTGIIALSSTTFVTNAFAGLMLRLIRNFKAGDFIRVNDLFGRITERGLFHTEIQTEERDLTTFPNLYLITNPMTVVRASGTIISATLSLGYDVSHQHIDSLLLKAAEQTGLKDPFVQVVSLGDFSVSYKISGFLTDTKKMLAMRSNLKRAVLDVLHGAGVEIVSPNFMNQRVLAKEAAVIPEAASVSAHKGADPAELPENLIFDKAETAQEKVLWQGKLAALQEKRELLMKRKDPSNADALKKIEMAMEKIKKRIEKVDEILDADGEKGKEPL
jgi:small-conductance mechanosensitive channel